LFDFLFFFVFILLVTLLVLIRKYFSGRKVIETGTTWGCGYCNNDSRRQYTASSFVKSYSKLAKPILEIQKKELEITEVFPAEKHYKTDSYDKIEHLFIDYPLKLIEKITNLFLFLQNGQLQRYILYGIIFITAVLILPLIFDKMLTILHFLNNL